MPRAGLSRQSRSETSKLFLLKITWRGGCGPTQFLADNSESNAPFSEREKEMKDKQKALYAYVRESHSRAWICVPTQDEGGTLAGHVRRDWCSVN